MSDEPDIVDLAAQHAVADVPAQMQAAGATKEQAEAIGQAMKLLLVQPDDSSSAREVLQNAGFDEGAQDQILARIRSSFRAKLAA
jgi:hypothetical protein